MGAAVKADIPLSQEDLLRMGVNLIDLFLVIIAVLLIVVVENPLSPFASDDVVVVKNPGNEDMEMIIKKGEELTHYRRALWGNMRTVQAPS